METKNVDIVVSEKLAPYLYTIKDGTTLNDKATLSVIIGLFVARTITLENIFGSSVYYELIWK